MTIYQYKMTMNGDKDVSRVAELVGELARVFTDDPKSSPIWPSSAKSLLTAMILFLLEKGYENDCLDKLNMYSVYNFFLEFGSRNEPKNINGALVMVNALDELFQGLPIGNPAKLAYATSNFSTGDMRSSIFSTLADSISIFSDSGIAKLTSGNDIIFEDLIDKDHPCAIFMVVPDEKKNRHVIASLFVNQCYSTLVDLASKFPMQKLPQRVQFILDEFGNMVRIPDMDVKLTVALGRNIVFNLFTQDLNQIDSKYGDLAKTIRSNCGNFIYINSIDNDTNDYVSHLLGNRTVKYETYSGDLGDWLLKHENTNYKARSLLTAEELTRLEFGEAVIKRQRCYPIRTKFQPYYELGLSITPITDIPMGYSNRTLSEWMFPFEKITGKAQQHNQPDHQPQQKKTKNSTELALAIINKLTNNAFQYSLSIGDYMASLRIINDMKLQNKMSLADLNILQKLVSVQSGDNE